jgi:hypothetical protein
MAGDGGRVPDVSEQRAEALYNAVERGATALCRFVFPGYIVPRIEMARAVIDAYNDGLEGWMDRLPLKRVLHGPLGSDPASVLAALLAESPEATVAAIEALLTTDEAGEAGAALVREVYALRTAADEAMACIRRADFSRARRTLSEARAAFAAVEGPEGERRCLSARRSKR